MRQLLAHKLRTDASGAKMHQTGRQRMHVLYEKDGNALPQMVAQLWIEWDASSARYASNN